MAEDNHNSYFKHRIVNADQEPSPSELLEQVAVGLNAAANSVAHRPNGCVRLALSPPYARMLAETLDFCSELLRGQGK